MCCMADMKNLVRRLSLALLLFLLLIGAADHLFLSAYNISHATQEANCPIHSGMAQLEKAKLFIIRPVTAIGEMQDSTHALGLTAKITHPPTF